MDSLSCKGGQKLIHTKDESDQYYFVLKANYIEPPLFEESPLFTLRITLFPDSPRLFKAIHEPISMLIS